MSDASMPGNVGARAKPLPAFLSVSRLMLAFVVTNIVCAFVFWLARIPIMNDETHFQETSTEKRDGPKPAAAATAAYVSIMTQTTVGASTIAPMSGTARTITGLQAVTALGSVLIVALLVGVHGAHAVTAQTMADAMRAVAAPGHTKNV